MVKIYKYNNKLAIYLPFDVIKELSLSESDEIDFFKYKGNAFLFAKKADIADLLTGTKSQPQEKAVAPAERPPMQQRADLSQDEIAVLKKLDTLRYNQRTQANVEKLLNQAEREIFKSLVKKKAISLFNGVYGISKDVYNRFLMRKRPQEQPASTRQTIPQNAEERRFGLLKVRGNIDDENIKKLEKDGFIVLQTESEAAAVSAALEDSIRHGQVFGTRAFNKKFYIMLRAFLEKYSSPVIKELKGGEKRVPELAEKTRLDENGVRAILYYMSEIGDVSEKKRDLFRLA